jgi:hypothetical protein
MPQEREGDVPVIILGPLSDSLLHGVGSTAISYSADSQIVTFKALQGIAKGDRISIGCGLTSNLELLANRGSVLPTNRNNFVLIKFQLDPESDMHAGARQSMLGKLNLTSPMTYIVRSGEMPQGLLTSLRIQSMTPVEFALYEKAAVAPLSLENEWRSYRLLISSCNTILSMYKTSVEEDDELLRAGILTDKASLAVTLRRQVRINAKKNAFVGMTRRMCTCTASLSREGERERERERERETDACMRARAVPIFSAGKCVHFARF